MFFNYCVAKYLNTVSVLRERASYGQRVRRGLPHRLRRGICKDVVPYHVWRSVARLPGKPSRDQCAVGYWGIASPQMMLLLLLPLSCSPNMLFKANELSPFSDSTTQHQMKIIAFGKPHVSYVKAELLFKCVSACRTDKICSLQVLDRTPLCHLTCPN